MTPEINSLSSIETRLTRVNPSHCVSAFTFDRIRPSSFSSPGRRREVPRWALKGSRNKKRKQRCWLNIKPSCVLYMPSLYHLYIYIYILYYIIIIHKPSGVLCVWCCESNLLTVFETMSPAGIYICPSRPFWAENQCREYNSSGRWRVRCELMW